MDKSATVNNETSAFKATGIVPFNLSANPDDAYLTENSNLADFPDAVPNNQNSAGSSQSFPKAIADNNQQPCCSWQAVGETILEKQNGLPAPVGTIETTPIKCTSIWKNTGYHLTCSSCFC